MKKILIILVGLILFWVGGCSEYTYSKAYYQRCKAQAYHNLGIDNPRESYSGYSYSSPYHCDTTEIEFQTQQMQWQNQFDRQMEQMELNSRLDILRSEIEMVHNDMLLNLDRQ